jgi:8-oxo-dGTP pyrophosphatase MutT (NUDIX family)
MSKNSNLRKQLSGKKAKNFREFTGSFEDFTEDRKPAESSDFRTRKGRDERKNQASTKSLRRSNPEKRLSRKLAIENNSRKDGADKRAAEVREHLSARDFTRNDRSEQRQQGVNSRPVISEMVREATAGGVIFRENPMIKKLEILLVADHFDRWTIPKGHIEEGETAQETAIREIGEEAGLHKLDPICWLGKIHFRYRRENVLVLMSTQIYLFRALGDTDDFQKEEWMNGIRWFRFDEAVDIIAYEDIAKLMILAKQRLENRGII